MNSKTMTVLRRKAEAMTEGQPWTNYYRGANGEVRLASTCTKKVLKDLKRGKSNG